MGSSAIAWIIAAPCFFFNVPLDSRSAGAALFALDWPVARRIITGTFGENRGDHFHNGIDVGGGEQPVFPVLPGELVFRYDENSDYTSFPRGVGTFVALHHDDHVVSVYAHLKRGSLGPIHDIYGESDRIGTTGDTGHSEGTHLHFIVYDEETSQFVNPLALLPRVPDRQAPVIRRILLSHGERARMLEKGVTVPPGRWEILLESFDLREDVRFHWPTAPYSVLLQLNGRQVFLITFDSIRMSDMRMVVGGTTLYPEDVYTSEGLLRCGSVELGSGESQLIVAVRDYAGNETTRDTFFTVRE